VGLDIALAPMALRRINLAAFADAPRVPSNERDAFAVNVVLVDARALRDADRAGIAAAIDRGRSRIAGVVAGRESADALAESLALDGWRRRELHWLLEHEPTAVPKMFSLVELMTAGGGPRETTVEAG